MEKLASDTRIRGVRPGGGKTFLLTLEDNPFRGAGGGQPGASGELRGEDFLAEVKDGREEEGEVWLEVTCRRGAPRPGLAVEARVDGPRRALLSRHHSGEHLLSRILEDAHPGLAVHKVAVGEESTSVYFTYDGEVDWAMLFSAEDRAREVVASDLPVTIQEYSREEGQKIPRLKVNWDRVHSPTLRVVRIGEDLDVIACSGSHVSSTGEIGEIFITGFNGAPPEWSFTFTVHGEAREREYGRLFRRVLRTVGCEPGQLEKVFERLQGEKGALQKTLDKVRPLVALPWERHALGEHTLDVAVVTALPPEMATPAVKRHVEAHPRGVALVLLPGAGDDRVPFVLARGAEVAMDLRGAIKDPELGARGGGAPEWVSGMVRGASVAPWLRALGGAS